MNEKKIVDLEIRMTHLENYLNQLNEIVLENGNILKSIKKEQDILKEQMNDVSSQLPSPKATRPPHY
ncbi:MAG: SlyX family protein [Spirochaetaceae bacterium]|nr:SlyX family protein [Spirochaetaceae bacterium]